MKVLRQTLGIAVTGLLLAVGPATADGGQRTRPAGSTSSDTGERAVPRDTSTPPRDTSTPSRDTSTPSRDTSTPSPDTSTPSRDTSTPSRDTSTPSRDTSTPSRDTGGDGRRVNVKDVKRDSPSDTRETPEWSRPRGDRPATDIAVTRTGPRPPRDSDDRKDRRECHDCSYPEVVYAPYYDPFAYYECGYGLGFDLYPGGYYGYPLYSPYGFGYGMPYGYAPCGAVYDGGGSPPNPIGTISGQKQGALKLKVKPRNAKVYVDGFYVGTVDQFDGGSQKLALNEGRHKVELKAEGFETAELDVDVTAERTVTFAGKMIQLKKNQ